MVQQLHDDPSYRRLRKIPKPLFLLVAILNMARAIPAALAMTGGARRLHQALCGAQSTQRRTNLNLNLNLNLRAKRLRAHVFGDLDVAVAVIRHDAEAAAD